MIVCKGDWKWSKEFYEQERNYSNLAGPRASGLICPGCFAGQVGKPWLDPTLERFHNVPDLQLAQQTAVGGSIALLGLPGFCPTMVWPDLLHTVWLGTGRDAVGSLLMELAEFDPRLQEHHTWDERLRAILEWFRVWCAANHVESSLDDLSLVKLSVDAISYDFPNGFPKGYMNKLMHPDCKYVFGCVVSVA